MRKDVDDDTIELMLSPEQMRVLSSAAATAEATAGPNASPMAAGPTMQANTAPPRHCPAGGVAAIVGVIIVLSTLVALGAIAQRSSERRHVAAALPPIPAPAVTTPVAQQDPPPPPAEPVRFKNPFDHSEVFEFPPGTSLVEAREAVAQLLMERARDRHAQLVYRKHSATRRAATERIAGGPVSADLAQNSARPR